MPLTGTYSVGGATTSLSNSYSTIDELLIEIIDNTSNLINAKDIRDSVYSLWTRIDGIQVVASQSASASSFYTNSNPVPVTVGGISSGTTFNGTYSLQQMFDKLLYPYIAPTDSMGGLGIRQYGSSILVTLNWSVTKNSNTITSIIVNGTPVTPTGNSQTGVQNANGTHSTTPGISQTNTFGMSTSDGTTTANASTSLTWMNKRYWGYIDLSSIGDPNLTTNPGSASIVGAYITDARVIAMTGANANSQLYGNELATSLSKTYSGINGSGNHLVFAFPTAFGTPNFTVNGLPNTAFTKVRSNLAFTNELGFSGTNYDVWVTNTLQNSPLNIILS